MEGNNENNKSKSTILKVLSKIGLTILYIIGALAIVLILYMSFAAIVRNYKKGRRRRNYRRQRRNHRRDDDYYF